MIDAHCHLQHPQFQGTHTDLVRDMRGAGITAAVVNGTCESDWPAVSALCENHHNFLRAAYGLHPWHVLGCSPQWKNALERRLIAEPGASIGECGIDHWRKDIPKAVQREMFRIHAELSCKLDRPMSIHGLKAWSAVHAVLKDMEALPPFLLHSYSGPREMIAPFVALGGYFSFSAFFFEPRKNAVLEMFRHIPEDRLVIETDAPDMKGPALLYPHHFYYTFHHPLALIRTAELLAEYLQISYDAFTKQTSANTQRLFRLENDSPSPR